MSGPDLTQTQVAYAVLQTGSWDFTSSQTIAALVTWFAREGGGGPQWGITGNIASYNPLNTTLPLPGSIDTPGNNPPVQAYTSWAQGIQATVLTLQENQRGYDGIRNVLATGGGCQALAAAVSASAWGTPDFSSMCGGVPVPPPPPSPQPPLQPGVGLWSGWRVGSIGWGKIPLTPPPGMFAWWKADAITGVPNGTPLASWVDSSGNGHTLLQATANQRPSWSSGAPGYGNINGLPVVFWGPDEPAVSGLPHLFMQTAAFPAISQPGTVGFVAQQNNVQDFCTILDGINSSNRWNLFYDGVFGSNTGYGMYAGGTPFSTNQPGIAPACVIALFDGPSSHIARDNGTPVTGNPGSETVTGFSVGNVYDNRAGDQMTGFIGEIIIYNRLLTSTEMAQLYAYLKQKWGTP